MGYASSTLSERLWVEVFTGTSANWIDFGQFHALVATFGFDGSANSITVNGATDAAGSNLTEVKTVASAKHLDVNFNDFAEASKASGFDLKYAQVVFGGASPGVAIFGDAREKFAGLLITDPTTF